MMLDLPPPILGISRIRALPDQQVWHKCIAEICESSVWHCISEAVRHPFHSSENEKRSERGFQTADGDRTVAAAVGKTKG